MATCNLKANGYATTRMSTDASKQNPVLALPHNIHTDITKAQYSFDANSQLPYVNIKSNANILYSHPHILNNSIDELLEKTMSHYKSIIK